MIDAQAIVASFDSHEEAVLAPEMRTVLLHHGARTARVVVLLHGLTASPRVWREFAQMRHTRGETVLVPRLPRHGYADLDTRTLAKLVEEELRTTATRVVTAASQLGDEIVIVGHSLGGALALHLAHEDARVSRAIAIAPFLGIGMVPHDWGRLASRLLTHAPNMFLYWDPIDRGRSLPKHGYPRYTTRALAAILALADALRADAAHGPPRAPHVEIVRNVSESAVNNRAIDELVRLWRAAGGAHVRVHRLVGLGPSHDIIEPERPRAPARRFLPHLHALLDAAPPDRDLVLRANG